MCKDCHPLSSIIDADYRGEWMAIFTQIPVPLGSHDGFTSFPYNVGDRVGQIFFEPVIPISFEVVPELDQSERGEGGFGSTGLK